MVKLFNKGDDKESKTQLSDIIDILADSAYNFIKWKIISSTKGIIEEEPEGLPDGYNHYNHDKMDEIVELVKPLLQKSQQIRELEAKNSQDIIKLMGRGKINSVEAKELLMLMKTKLEVEEIEMENKLKKQLIENL